METCAPSCQTCSGTTETCTSCFTPSDQPIQLGNTCVTSCPSDHFLLEQVCYKCHEYCESCYGYKDLNCLKCKKGYFFENGACKIQCSKNTIDTGGQCVSVGGANGACDPECETCTKDTTFCLTCKEGATPILDMKNGKCVADKMQSCPKGFFTDSKAK
jgi:proprotein convertase subtilisin/kexin type 5